MRAGRDKMSAGQDVPALPTLSALLFEARGREDVLYNCCFFEICFLGIIDYGNEKIMRNGSYYILRSFHFLILDDYFLESNVSLIDIYIIYREDLIIIVLYIFPEKLK